MEGEGKDIIEGETRFNQRIQEIQLMRDINQSKAWSDKGWDQIIHSQK